MIPLLSISNRPNIDSRTMWSLLLDPASQTASESHQLAIERRSKLISITNSGISDLQPWSAFIFSICAVLVVATCYLAEKFLLETVYKATYRKLIDAAVIDRHERRR